MDLFQSELPRPAASRKAKEAGGNTPPPQRRQAEIERPASPEAIYAYALLLAAF